MQLLNTLQQDILEVVSQQVNVLILLSDNYEDHLFYVFTQFEGQSRSNIGSVEHNFIRGVNISTFVRNQQGTLHNRTNPVALMANLHTFLEEHKAVTVKYANLPYLIFESNV